MKSKHFKIVSLLLSLVLIISSCFVISALADTTSFKYQKYSFEFDGSDFKAGTSSGFSGGLYSVTSGTLKWKPTGFYERNIIFNNGTSKIQLTAGDYVVTYDWKAVKADGYSITTLRPSEVHAEFALTDGSETQDISQSTSYHVLASLFEYSEIKDVEEGTDASVAKTNVTVEFTVTEAMVNAKENYLSLNVDSVVSALYFDNVVIYKKGIDVKFGTKTVFISNADTTENISAPAHAGVTAYKLGENTYNVGDNIPVVNLRTAADTNGDVTLTPVIDTTHEGAYKSFTFESGFISNNTTFSGSMWQVVTSSDTEHGKVLRWKDTGGYHRGVIFNDGTNKLQLPVGKYIITYEYKAVRKDGYSANANSAVFSMKFLLTKGETPNNMGTTYSGPDAVTYNDIADVESAASTSDAATEWKQGIVEIEVTNETTNYLVLNANAVRSAVYFDNVYIYKTDVTVDFVGGDDVSIDKYSPTAVTAPSATGVAAWKLGNNTYNPGDTIHADVLAANIVNDKVTVTPVMQERNVYKTFGFESGTFSVGAFENQNGSAYFTLSNTKYLNGSQSLKWKHTGTTPYERGIRFNDGSNLLALPAGRYVVSYNWNAVESTSTLTTAETFAVKLTLTNGKSITETVTGGVDLLVYNDVKSVLTETNVTETGWQKGVVEIVVTADDVTNGTNKLYMSVKSTGLEIYFDDFVIYDDVQRYGFGNTDAGIENVYVAADNDGNVTLPDLYYQSAQKVKLGNVEYIIDGEIKKPGDTVSAAKLSKTDVLKPSFGAMTFSLAALSAAPSTKNLGSGLYNAAAGYVSIKNNSSDNQSKTMLLYQEGDVLVAAGYNPGEVYQVSVKVSLDTETSYDQKAYIVFGTYVNGTGANAYNNNTAYRAGASEFTVPNDTTTSTTITSVVTAPNSYKMEDGSARYSPLIALGVQPHSAATFKFEEVTITPMSVAVNEAAPEIKSNYLFINNSDSNLSDATGDRMLANSAVYSKAGTNYVEGSLADENERAAFRIAASYTYTGTKDKITIGNKVYTVKKRGFIIGKATATKDDLLAGNNVLGGSETNATADCWKDENSVVEYTFKIYNVSSAKKDNKYTAVAYLIIEVEGKEYTVYSEMKTMSAQSVYDNYNGSAGLKWFS